MTRRIDPREANRVIAKLRAANPVRRESGEQTPEQVDAFLLQVMERTDMVQDITKQVGSSRGVRGRQQMPKWVGVVAGFALAALIAIPVVLVNQGPGDAALESLPASQAVLVSDVVKAINTEDYEAFQMLFSDEGRGVGFETGLNRPYHEGVSGGQPIPVTDETGFEADFTWGAILDRRISPRTCESDSPRVFRCEIAFTLGAWRAEWIETMSVALAEDGQISLLSTEPFDLNPVDREQPLSLTGHYEFRDWLAETYPDEYQRLIDPGTPGSINGVELTLGATPQNPDLVDDFTALVDEYIASR